MKHSIIVERKTDKMIKITAKDPKARIHQFGLKPLGATNPLPKRPFMYLTKSTMDSIMDQIDVITQEALEGKRIREKKLANKETWKNWGRDD